jgi:hypothetical protein
MILSAKKCAKHASFFPSEQAERPLSEFGPNSQNADGKRYECRRCFNAYQAATRKSRAKAPREAVATSEAPAAPIAAPDPLTVALEAHKAARDRRDLKAEHGALLDENERLRRLIDEMVGARKAPEIIVYDKPQWERADAIMCALASDWHVEEPVEAAAVHGLNAYNLEIARSRSEHFFKNFLRLALMMARESRITTIYLGVLGDFFSGWIHEELIAGNLLPPGEAARFWRGLFASGIDFLLRESEFTIEADMIPGNHGRMTRQVHFGDPTGTSLETFAYHFLAGRYEGNARVRLNVSPHAMVYRTMFERFRMRLIHGYEVKFGGGVGGITIPINKAVAQWDKGIRADLTCLGHFHQKFDGGSFLVNGSLIGYNTFAQGIKASPEEAQQVAFMIHARNGGTRAGTFPIWLDDAHKIDKVPEAA